MNNTTATATTNPTPNRIKPLDLGRDRDLPRRHFEALTSKRQPVLTRTVAEWLLALYPYNAEQVLWAVSLQRRPLEEEERKRAEYFVFCFTMDFRDSALDLMRRLQSSPDFTGQISLWIADAREAR